MRPSPAIEPRTRGARFRWGGVLAALLCASAARAQEGALRNDAYVPTAPAVAEALARGDDHFEASREKRASLVLALEAWREALELAEVGDAVPLDVSPLRKSAGALWRDPDSSYSRRCEDASIAVQRRLTQGRLGPEDPDGRALRAAWRARFGELAGVRLHAAGTHTPALARLEHAFPLTRSAAIAACRLSDLALEEGRPLVAAGWLERARAHAAEGSDAPEGQALADALAVRSRLQAGDPAPDEGPRPAWEGASGLRLAGKKRLAFLPGGRQGLARLADGRFVAAGRGVVWVVDGTKPGRLFETWKLLEEQGLQVGGDHRRPGPGWDWTPGTDGEHLYCVLGRAEELEGLDERSGSLVCVLPPEGLGLPELRWVLGPDGLWSEGELRGGLEAVLGAGLWEFQPGPLVLGSRLLVQARQWRRTLQPEGLLELSTPGQVESWALCLDCRSGRLLWKRRLARGSDLRPDIGGPLLGARRVRTAAAPPLRSGPRRVLFPTQLGSAHLLDPTDGRLLWSFLSRRRDLEAPGWSPVLAAVPLAPTTPAAPAGALLLAPSDSDHLYRLAAGPDLVGRGLLLEPPRAIGEAEALVGGRGAVAYFLGRAGARRTLAAIDAASGRRIDSVYLGREERTLGCALVSPARALFASDRGLYLLDVERELYLLQHLPLDYPDPAPEAGRLYAFGDQVLLLTAEGLWTFTAE